MLHYIKNIIFAKKRISGIKKNITLFKDIYITYVGFFICC